MTIFKKRRERKQPPVIPKALNQKTARKLLEAYGWTQTLGGKHVVKMVKPGCRPITLPHNHGEDYPPGLRAAILREAGLSEERRP
jgi:predicted RNA binding protein YcfA (HicA-like mRNA interferase family)